MTHTKDFTDLVLVTNWDEVEEDDFYLTDEWLENGGKENVEKARELQKEKKLFVAYVVPAVWLCVYQCTDSDQVFIDEDGNEILRCETAVIETKDWQHIEEYSG